MSGVELFPPQKHKRAFGGIDQLRRIRKPSAPTGIMRIRSCRR